MNKDQVLEMQHAIGSAAEFEAIQEVEKQQAHEATIEGNAAAMLRLTDTSKADREALAQRIVEHVTEGWANPLEAHISLKNLEDVLKLATGNEAYKAAVLAEAEKMGKSFETHNAKIQVKEVGTKWDYSQTNDSVLASLQQQADALDKQIKERQKFLQTIPDGGMADPATGEMVFKAAKSSTTSVSVTLK